MSDTNFQPIFDYIDEANKQLKDDIIQDVDAKLGGIHTKLDNLVKDVKDLTDEMKASHHRHDKVETWVRAAAPKLNVTFHE